MTTKYRLTNANPFPVAYDAAGHTVDPYTAVEAELDPTVQHLVDTGVLGNTGPVDEPATVVPEPVTPPDQETPDMSAFLSTPGKGGRNRTSNPTAPAVDNGEDTRP